jgi:5-methylcytosine-specific restriction endonuclease McrA
MKKVTRQDLIAEFNRLAKELDKRPTLSEFNEHGEYSSTPVYNVFGSFEELKDAAGFETGEQKIADETLLDDLRRVAKEIGRTPPVELYQEHGEHNHKTLTRRWDNWHGVLDAAGLEPTEHSEHWEDTEYTDKKYGTVMVDCAYCGDDVPRQPSEIERWERTFCGPECKGDFMSTQTGKEARSWEGGKVEITCEWCEDTREVRPSEAESSRFCSQGCMLEWRSTEFVGEDHQRFKEDTEEIYYGPNFTEQRLKALERDNHRCQVCGKTNQQNIKDATCGLNCHHIRKFKEYDGYEQANRLENLVMLCSECHQYVENHTLTVPTARWHRQEATKSVLSDAPIQRNLTLYMP